MAENRIVKFCARVGPRSIRVTVRNASITSHVMTNCPQVGLVKVMWRLSFFWQISANISKAVQDRDILTMED